MQTPFQPQPVVLHQNLPVHVEVTKNTAQLVGATLLGIVAFTHFISCLVFLVFMYKLNEAINAIAENLDKLHL